MSLIDGRYEVLSELQLGGGCTQFTATAPDGTPLRIEWFDLEPHLEAEFERHRRVIRRLAKEGRAAVHDVVSRPGAHYVAWLERPDAARDATRTAGNGVRDRELEELLSSEGYPPEAALIARDANNSGPALLYGLAFGSASVTRADPPPEPPARPLKRLSSAPLSRLEELPPVTLSWGAAGLLLLLTAILAAVGFSRLVTNDLVVVPDLTGRPAQEAADELAALSLRVLPLAVASSAPAGEVLGVEPPPGAELRPGRSVTLSYALPAGQLQAVETPSVVGAPSVAAAGTALTERGLRLGEVARLHAPEAPGAVLAQSVAPGSRLPEGGTVDLLVSLGPAQELTFVPHLVGLSADEAVPLAELAGFQGEQLRIDEIDAPSGQLGEVLSQSLAPNVPVPLESSVLRLVVQASGGGGERSAPDLVGLPLSEAQRAASELSVNVRSLATPNLPEGVVAQTPEPGAPLAGSELTLVVNAHPRPLTTAGVRAEVREPLRREVPYAWTILPGIRSQVAEVWATDIEGRRSLVKSVTVIGGEILRGSWVTNRPGPITFELRLGGVPYGEPLLVP